MLYKSITIFCSVLLLFSLTNAQLKGSIEAETEMADPFFFHDVVTYPLETRDSVEVEIRVKVPFDAIQFLKVESYFEAKYELSVLVINDKKQTTFSKIWTQTLKTESFQETNSNDLFDVNEINFRALPAKYTITIGVLDLDTRKSKYKKVETDIEDIYKKPISISKITLIEKIVQDPDGSERGIPSVENAISDLQKEFHISFDILSPGGKGKIEYIIYDMNRKMVFMDKLEKTFPEGISHEIILISKEKLSFSRYKIVLTVKIGNHEVMSEKTFQLRWQGMSNMIENLDLAIDQLKYLAGSKEIKVMRKASKVEKKELFLKFWKKRDPTPNTEENEIMNEYYRRAYFANENFSGFQPGWQTDMGMIFILFGAPNDIERHPFDTESKPYEIWHYYELNRTFVFVDESGFGEYRLITPLYDYHGKY